MYCSNLLFHRKYVGLRLQPSPINSNWIITAFNIHYSNNFRKYIICILFRFNSWNKYMVAVYAEKWFFFWEWQIWIYPSWNFSECWIFCLAINGWINSRALKGIYTFLQSSSWIINAYLKNCSLHTYRIHTSGTKNYWYW